MWDLGALGDRALPLAELSVQHKYSLPVMIKRFLLVYFLSIFALGSQAASPVSGEYIILVGGPSMYQWEKYKTYPHDHWWANFIRAARIRTEQLRTDRKSTRLNSSHSQI